MSALSEDCGLAFRKEPGVRIGIGDLSEETLTAFAPATLRLTRGGYRTYYAGYADTARASILSAESEDGVSWRKVPEPVVVPGGRLDASKRSEMCVTPLSKSAGPVGRYRLFYEAYDGTAPEKCGVWRILSATSVGGNKDDTDDRQMP